MPFYVPRSHSGDINVFGIDSRYFIFTMLSHVSEMKGWHLLYIDVYEVKHENSDLECCKLGSSRPILYRLEWHLLNKVAFKVILRCLGLTAVVSYLQCLVM